MIGEGRSADTLHATICMLSLPALIDRFIRGIYSVSEVTSVFVGFVNVLTHR